MNNFARFSHAPSGLRLLAAGTSALAWLAVLGWIVLAMGCATPAPAPERPAVSATHLEVVNLTSYEWRVAIASSTGSEAVTERIAPQASVRINLRGGDYVIEQTVLTAGPGPELTRRIPARLEPGQTYRWPLVTLLSDPTAGVPENKPRD